HAEPRPARSCLPGQNRRGPVDGQVHGAPATTATSAKGVNAVGRSLCPTIARWRAGHARSSGAGHISTATRPPAANTAPKQARTKITVAVTGLGALSLLAAACGGPSSSSSSPTTGVSLNSGLQAVNPGTGTPQRGGTLNLLGTGDVDFMDYNISYY